MSYYDELGSWDDEARRVGWRHRIEQAYRFEAALEVARSTTGPILDVGCGLGAFRAYLRASKNDRQWVGLEREKSFLRRVDGDVIAADYRALDPSEIGVFGCAVAIGTLSSGDDPHEAMRALLTLCGGVTDAFFITVLDVDRIGERPAMAVEPALGAVSRSAVDQVVAGLPHQTTVVELTRTDLAICAWKGDSPDLRSVEERFDATVQGPWGVDASASRKAWLAYEVGLDERADEWLARNEGPLDELGRLVGERLRQASGELGSRGR